jgi:peptide/nickel transport system ATP-binding protein
MTEAVAEVTGLHVRFRTSHGWLRAVDGIDLTVAPGESLALVGESGCGKTVTALSMMGLIPKPGIVTASTIRVAGTNVVSATAGTLRQLRGQGVGMVFQDPMSSLHPTLSVGRQLAEALMVHNPRLAQREALRSAVDLLEEVGIPDPGTRAGELPHTWSGGMRQRAMIAIAVANRPRLLIADEPTTALDVTIQAQVLALLRRLRDDTGMALLLITHDLGVIAEMTDRVLVIYGGRVVEEGRVPAMFHQPLHPYTRGLLDSLPRIDQPEVRLRAIPGRAPRLATERKSCAFAPRCDCADGVCLEEDPVLEGFGGGRSCACFHTHEPVVFRGRKPTIPVRRASDKLLLRVDHLVVNYRTKGGTLTRSRAWSAVEGLSFRINQGETLALVGESGCGKSTTAKALLRLIEPASGKIDFDGVDVLGLDQRRLRRWRRRVQAVFQDPHSSLNPRKTAFQIVAGPLRMNGLWNRGSTAKVMGLLELVGIDRHHTTSRPAELSGGQRQRVGIARALVLDPSLVILDEPVSALDTSIRAQILNLLADLRDEMGLSYLFISHDLSAVAHLADRVAIMYLGQIVEMGETSTVFGQPAHPYTEALLASVPSVTSLNRTRRVLRGEVPDPRSPPSGCRFHPRCPHAQPLCSQVSPALEGDDHQWACHFPVGRGS